MAAMRQIGVGTAGGAEALAIFHQLIYDEWAVGGLARPFARIEIDETYFSGPSNGTPSAKPRIVRCRAMQL